MKLAIMQPYLFPYIGYFQLLKAVDKFVIYDNIKFTKKGWINRNRILLNGTDGYITFPLKKDSDYLDVKDRYLADNYDHEQKKILNKITESYRNAAQYKIVYPIIEECILSSEKNLFKFILNSLEIIKKFIGIQTPLIISSAIPVNHELKAEQKVLAICKAMKANEYYNPIGGMEFYSTNSFKNEGIKLYFLRPTIQPYPQLNHEFIPALSVLDIMMFNSKEQIQNMLHHYTLE